MDRCGAFSGFWLLRMRLAVHTFWNATGTSFAEMLRNFELQRDKEFMSQCLR